jgi:single-strand DNA-binding protein
MSVRRHLAHVGANLCAFPNGAAVTNFRIAVTARVRDGNTWRDGDTSFFRVNAWRQLAQHVTDSLGKGDRAVVIGWLKSRSWETPEGDQRSVIEIEADEIAPSLKWATAKPERVSRNGDSEAKPAGEFADEPAF